MLFNACARVFGQAVNFDWIGLLGKLLILFLHSLYKLLLKWIVKVYSPLGKLKKGWIVLGPDVNNVNKLPMVFYHLPISFLDQMKNYRHSLWLQTPKIPALLPFTSLLRENDEKCFKIVTDCNLRNGMKCLQNREEKKSRLSSDPLASANHPSTPF